MMDNYDFYLAVSLRNGKYESRNKAIEDIFTKANKKVFRPTLTADRTPSEILDRNIQAIKNSNNFLFVADDPGEGVFIELGYALALNKGIYVVGSNTDNFGKMFKGIVATLPQNQLFYSLQDLEKSLN